MGKLRTWHKAGWILAIQIVLLKTQAVWQSGKVCVVEAALGDGNKSLQAEGKSGWSVRGSLLEGLSRAVPRATPLIFRIDFHLEIATQRVFQLYRCSGRLSLGLGVPITPRLAMFSISSQDGSCPPSVP